MSDVTDVDASTDAQLCALPSQHPTVAWPLADWPTGRFPTAVDEPAFSALIDAAFLGDDGPMATTNAVAITHHGRIIYERYGPDVDSATPHLSWSIAKSILHGFLGTVVADGLIDIDAPVGLPQWQQDERKSITLRHLLTMRSGLAWNEDYVDGDASNVIEMLFGSGLEDHAAYAAGLELVDPPGTVWNYSSGTSNIVSLVTARALGLDSEAAYRKALQERLFGPLRMTSANPGFDASGNFVASSYVHATARDYLRFGHLYLRDGTWANKRMLPEGWVDLARTTHATDPETNQGYGHHWWTEPDRFGSFAANGYDGQRIQIVPSAGLVFVRFGKTPQEKLPALRQWYRDLTEVFEPLARF